MHYGSWVLKNWQCCAELCRSHFSWDNSQRRIFKFFGFWGRYEQLTKKRSHKKSHDSTFQISSYLPHIKNRHTRTIRINHISLLASSYQFDRLHRFLQTFVLFSTLSTMDLICRIEYWRYGSQGQKSKVLQLQNVKVATESKSRLLHWYLWRYGCFFMLLTSHKSQQPTKHSPSSVFLSLLYLISLSNWNLCRTFESEKDSGNFFSFATGEYLQCPIACKDSSTYQIRNVNHHN